MDHLLDCISKHALLYRFQKECTRFCAGSSVHMSFDSTTAAAEAGEGVADGSRRDLRRRHVAGGAPDTPSLLGGDPRARSLPRHSGSTFWGFVISVGGGLIYR